MQKLVLAATEKEILPFKEAFPDANILIGGVGTVSTVYQLMKYIFLHKVDFIIQAGIAGSFNKERALGSVVVVQNDVLSQSGVWEQNQIFTLGEKGISDKVLPLTNNEDLNRWNLPVVDAVTIDLINDTELNECIATKYPAEIESMEGAALHYVCLKEQIPFVQLRAISNYVGDRNKQNWKIEDAIANLNKELIRIYTQLT